MAPGTLFDPSTAPDGAPVVADADEAIKAGDRFVFRGLVDQEPFEQRLPGSGSVGWVIEVLGVSPWGSLALRCAETAAAVSEGRVSAVGFADAAQMIRAGVWVRLLD